MTIISNTQVPVSKDGYAELRALHSFEVSLAPTMEGNEGQHPEPWYITICGAFIPVVLH